MKKFNRILSKRTTIFWSCLLLITFTSLCVNNYLSNTNLRSLASIKVKTIHSGELSIGVATNNPPFEFTQGENLVGFEVDIMREVATRLNLSPRFMAGREDELLNGLNTKTFDAVIAGLNISEALVDRIGFSNPYLVTHLCLFINDNAEPPIKTIHDLVNKKIGVFSGSTAYQVGVKMKQEKQIKEIKTYLPDQFLTLIDDLYHQHIDAALQEVLAVKYYTHLFPEIGILKILPDTYQMGIAFNVNQIDTIALTNQALVNMKKDGTFQQIYTKWFGGPSPKTKT